MLSDRGRSDANTDQWKQLLKTLCDFNDWLTKLEAEMRALQPPGGDLESLKSQEDDLQVSTIWLWLYLGIYIAPLRETFITLL